MKVLIYCIVLLLMSTTTTLCDFVTEDGIKVQLFKSKSKKPIPLKSYNLISENEYGFKEYGITVIEPIEKIILNGYFDDNLEDLSYKLTVFNDETKSIVLFKDTVTFTLSQSWISGVSGERYNGKEEGTTYILPISPWIISKGKYHILIERNNFLEEYENRILSIRYNLE
ncbi:MAG: hypothetical protein ACK5GO_07115 [Ignavibacteria bacterium]|jgi:hypothetical protein